MLRIVEIKEVKRFPSDREYYVILKHDVTPDVNYIIVDYGDHEKEVLISFDRFYRRELERAFSDLSLFKTHDGVVLPVYVKWADGDVEDKPEHHIWENDIAYITIQGVVGTSGGWFGAILKFKVNEKTLNEILARRVVKLWNKYVKTVILNEGDVIHPVPKEFKTPYEVRKVTVEAYDYVERKKQEIEIKIPKGLIEDVEKIIKEIPIKKIKKILERSIRELERIERQVGEIELLSTIIKRKKELRKNLLAKLHEDELTIS